MRPRRHEHVIHYPIQFTTNSPDQQQGTPPDENKKQLSLSTFASIIDQRRETLAAAHAAVSNLVARIRIQERETRTHQRTNTCARPGSHHLRKRDPSNASFLNSFSPARFGIYYNTCVLAVTSVPTSTQSRKQFSVALSCDRYHFHSGTLSTRTTKNTIVRTQKREKRTCTAQTSHEKRNSFYPPVCLTFPTCDLQFCMVLQSKLKCSCNPTIAKTCYQNRVIEESGDLSWRTERS